MKKIGIIGCGNIGANLAVYIEKELSQRAVLYAVADIDQARADNLSKSLKNKPRYLQLADLVKECDIIVESAKGTVVPAIAKEVIAHKKTLLVMSSGGFIGNENLFNEAEKSGAHFNLVSGAIAGLDAVKAAKIAGIESVEIITRKPPKGLTGAPYIVEKGINLDALTGETVIFSGTARDAIKGFPANVNVACTLSFAGIGLDKTKVSIITAPTMKTNSHEIRVQGSFGEIHTVTDNLPSPKNPKTSYLAVLSAMASLKAIVGHVHIGT
jgi:aspartate dehydrogenase